MPITEKVDHERREIHVKAFGSITMDDIRIHLAAERRKKGLAYRELIEAPEATVAFFPSDVRTIVGILRSYGQKGALGPTAIVVGNSHAYGMMRMLAILLEDVCELQPFRTRKEAEKWLAGASVTSCASHSGARG